MLVRSPNTCCIHFIDFYLCFFQLKALKKKHDKTASPLTMSKKVAELNPPPEFIATREELWQRLKAERETWLAAQTPQDIW